MVATELLKLAMEMEEERLKKMVATMGKLLRLWFCFLLHSILISQTFYRTYKIISAMSSLTP